MKARAMNPRAVALALPQPRRRVSGFTLTELLITVVMTSVLAALATPSFRSFIAGQRIKTVSFDVMSTLTMARSEAIKRQLTVTVTPGTGGWMGGWTVTEPGGTALGTQSALKDLSISCFADGVASACSTAISYASSGRLVGAARPAIQISSTDTNSVRCISIDLSGRPNSKVGSCT
jgi:type IV fimbrial biogenesis protein FimT